MDHSTNKTIPLFKGINRFARKIRQCIYILLAASMIGFSNAFYDESKMINNVKNWIQQEQVIDDEDIIE